MNKSYIYALAMAGLMVSCSSDDVVSVGAENAEDNTLQEIAINVSKPTTRATGSVDVTWHGQQINVLMCDKGGVKYSQIETAPETFENIYPNTLFYAPGGIDRNEWTVENKADAMDHVLKYYPLKGNFDFYAFHTGNETSANSTAIEDPTPAIISLGTDNVIAIETDNVSVEQANCRYIPVIIDGSNDLMTAKAVPTKDELAKIAEVVDATAYDNLTGENKAKAVERAYSSYAARRGVQPNLTFNHELARFTFQVIGGDEYAQNQGPIATKYKALGSQAEASAWPYQDEVRYATNTEIYYIPAENGTHYIKILNNNQFDAYEIASFSETLDNTYEGYLETTGLIIESIALKSKTTGKMLVARVDNVETTGNIVWEDAVDELALQQYPVMPDNITDQDAIAAWEEGKYTKGLVELIPLALTNAYQSIGEALIVAPKLAGTEAKSDDYECIINVYQWLPQHDKYRYPSYYKKPDKVTVKIDPTKVNTGDSQTPAYDNKEFAAGNTFDVKLKIYGSRQIDVNTSLKAWISGGHINVDTEELEN